MITLNIIGCGKVGQTLARLWSDSKIFKIQDILTRSVKSAEKAINFIGDGKVVQQYSQLRQADIIWLATSDEAIAPCCEALIKADKIKSTTILFHSSGTLSSDILAVSGAKVASAHPLMSFADPALSLSRFNNIYSCLEGDSEAVEVLKKAFPKHFTISSDKKILYHAASVMASNYLVTLVEAALQTYQQAGIERAMAEKLIEPLIKGAVENIIQLGTKKALTGPIARKEYSIVDKHYKALTQTDPSIAALYQPMAELTKRLFTP